MRLCGSGNWKLALSYSGDGGENLGEVTGGACGGVE
jgi:hypothetical protein